MSQERCNEAWANAVVTYCEVYGITVARESGLARRRWDSGAGRPPRRAGDTGRHPVVVRRGD